MIERDAHVIDAGAGCCESPGETDTAGGRRIGRWGTAVRAGAGLALLALALVVDHDHSWLGLPGAGSRVWGLLGGLVVLPLLVTLAMWLRGRSAAPLRAGHGAACAVTALAVVLWQILPVAIFTFIGASLLLLVARGDDGCELLAFPNWVLGRRDYLMCLPFTPVDRWERRRRAGAERPGAPRPVWR
ncbi:MAG TPA: hypothetical protein VFM58_20960 [Solirubrobacteraceae bacterium]|jgi:hypothetical protein|nr:hypothetical protein [Solirubrobacteraceae bacterium]